VKSAVEAGSYDEIIVSTLPRRVSRWLRSDLPRQIERLGLPVSLVTAEDRKMTLADRARAMPSGWQYDDSLR
jgi:hypothetical protein